MISEPISELTSYEKEDNKIKVRLNSNLLLAFTMLADQENDMFYVTQQLMEIQNIHTVVLKRERVF